MKKYYLGSLYIRDEIDAWDDMYFHLEEDYADELFGVLGNAWDRIEHADFFDTLSHFMAEKFISTHEYFKHEGYEDDTPLEQVIELIKEEDESESWSEWIEMIENAMENGGLEKYKGIIGDLFSEFDMIDYVEINDYDEDDEYDENNLYKGVIVFEY